MRMIEPRVLLQRVSKYLVADATARRNLPVHICELVRARQEGRSPGKGRMRERPDAPSQVLLAPGSNFPLLHIAQLPCRTPALFAETPSQLESNIQAF